MLLSHTYLQGEQFAQKLLFEKNAACLRALCRMREEEKNAAPLLPTQSPRAADSAS